MIQTKTLILFTMLAGAGAHSRTLAAPLPFRRNLAILGAPKTIICANSENVMCNVGTYGCIDNSPTLCTSAAEQVEDATTAWVRAVTKKNNPRLVADQFCSDGILWGTVSQTIRGGNEVGGDIEKYFDYFAKLPGLTVKKAEDNVAQVTGDVFVNNANVKWNSDAFDAPVNARMTFIYRRNKSHANGWCIFELHSSGMPDFNADLKAVSGTARKLMSIASVNDFWNFRAEGEERKLVLRDLFFVNFRGEERKLVADLGSWGSWA